MKTTLKTTMGNFAVSAEAEVNPDQFAILADAGLLQFTQRTPFSSAEKLMAGYDKRPAGFKRNSIEFSADNALTLESVLEKPIEIAEGVTITLSNISVAEYVPAVKEPMFASERAKYASKNGDLVNLQKLATAVGYAGEIGDGSAANAPVAFLEAIKTWVKAQLESV